MKNTTPHWIIIGVLSALLIAIGFKFIVLGNTAKGDDGRTAVLLEPSERQAVLGEMRVLLETTQTIVEALANDEQKLAETMNNCIACHTMYQLPVVQSHP